VAVLSLSLLCSGVGSALGLTVAALLAVEMTGTRAAAGLPMTAMSITAALVAQPLAGASLRIGRRSALSGALLLAALGISAMMLSPLWNSLPLLLVGSAAAGLAFVVQLQARFAATDLAEPATRGRDLSLVVWAITPGAVAGPNLVTLGSSFGASLGLPLLSGPLLIAAISLLTGSIVVFAGLRPDPLRVARGLPAPGSLAAAPAARGSLSAGLRGIRNSPTATLAVLTIAVAHLTMVGIMTGTPVHLQMLGEEAAPGAGSGAILVVIGLTISLHMVGMFAFSPLIGWLADRLSPSRVLLGALGLLAAAMLIAGFGQGSHPAVMVGLGLLGLGWSASLISGSALLAEGIAADVRVAAQGATDSVLGAAATLGAIAAGPALATAGFTALNLAALALVGLMALRWLWSSRSKV
jgi:MFS family permease